MQFLCTARVSPKFRLASRACERASVGFLDDFSPNTGGIRCTKAGAILRHKGYSNVNTIEGGITAYGRWLRSSGLPKSASLFKGLVPRSLQFLRYPRFF